MIYDPDLSDRLGVIVDADAEPVDVDEALAEFLVSFYRSTPDASRGDDHNFSRGNRKVGQNESAIPD